MPDPMPPLMRYAESLPKMPDAPPAEANLPATGQAAVWTETVVVEYSTPWPTALALTLLLSATIGLVVLGGIRYLPARAKPADDGHHEATKNHDH